MQASKAAKLSPEQLREINAVFNTFDKSGEGRINVDSLGSVFDSMGFSGAYAQKVQIITRDFFHARADDDGKISKDDFFEGMALIIEAFTGDESHSYITPPSSPRHVASSAPSPSPKKLPSTPSRDNVLVSDLQRQVVELRIANENLAAKVEFTQKQLKEAEAITNRITEDYVKSQEAVDALRKQLRTGDPVRERLKELAEQVESLKSQYEEAKHNETELRKNNSRLTTERAQAAAALNAATEELSKLKAERESLQHKVNASGVHALEKKQLQEEIEFLKSKLTEVEKEKLALTQLIATLKEAADRAERQAADDRVLLNDANMNLRQLETKLREKGTGPLSQSLSDELSLLNQRTPDSEALETRLKEAQEKVARLTEEKTLLQRQLEAMQSKLSVSDQELALATEALRNRLTIDKEKELRQKLAAEETSKALLEKLVRTQENDLFVLKMEKEKLGTENADLKGKVQSHANDDRVPLLEQEVSELKEENKALRHENSNLQTQLDEYKVSLKEDTLEKMESDDPDRSLTGGGQNRVFERFLCCFWCPVSDPPRDRRKKAKLKLATNV